MVAIAVLIKSWIACVSYLMIIGDCTSMVLLPAGAPSLLAGRQAVIVGTSLFFLWPLCSLKSMAPLANFSVVGILSALYSLFVLAYRYISQSYVAGALLESAPYAPKFEAFAGHPLMTAATPASTVLIATLAYAYTIHYSAPQFYEQLQPGPDGDKTARMRMVSYSAFFGSLPFFSAVMVCSFLTFGSSSQGMVLNNYAVTDGLAVAARLALSVSMLTSFPIIFSSFKAGLVSAVGARAEEMQRCKPKVLTLLLLLTMVPASLCLQNLGKLAALSGAVLASFLVYSAPSLMALSAARRGLLRSGGGRDALAERILQFTLVPAGVLLGLVGATQAMR
eukprot:TRINITY_DN63158_c0_g1_i1.p1 TRINITY_DN63158_c0_g1~~TRINITY_DN63158_c0_g1_i1.p1  ORF type:complete len:361 (-),score=19.47 TRINITY_DN63158_c0_g1_i1:450-1457(-)